MMEIASQQQGSCNLGQRSAGRIACTLILALAVGIALSATPTIALERSPDGRFWSVICTSEGIFHVDLTTGERRKSDRPSNQEQNQSCHSANGRRAKIQERKTG